MRLATLHVPQGARGAQRDSTIPPGTSWARFGDELLLYAEEPQWEDLRVERPGPGVLKLREHRATVKREHMHVVQNGRLFQQEHPDVPVILDRGRLLLVELAPDRARQLEGKDETCYGILPLEDNQVVFDVRKPATARTSPVAWVRALANCVLRSTLEANLTYLASFPTRYSTSTLRTGGSV